MDHDGFLTASRVVIVAGKGGVGKTSASAALALAASRCGLSVLVIAIDDDGNLPRVLDLAPGAPGVAQTVRSSAGGGAIRLMTITPDAALLEYLQAHGLGRLSSRLVRSGALELIANAVPGMRDILALGKIKQLERSGAADLIVVDGPASGHALTMLAAPAALESSVRTGPIHVQATDVLDLLGDADRCQVALVTVPEETPINELIETAFGLEEDSGISLGGVIVNAVEADPGPPHVPRPGSVAALSIAELDSMLDTAEHAVRFHRQRAELQRQHIERLAAELPLPLVELPVLYGSTLGRAELEKLADAMLPAVAPRRRPHERTG